MFENNTCSSRSTAMDSHLPCDVDSADQRPWSFPTSCSLGSLSLSGDCGESPSGKDFPSTGMIPILFFDDDVDCSDPTSLSPRLGVANHPRFEEEAGSSTGHRVLHDPLGVLSRLGIDESSAIRGPPGERSPTRGGNERSRLSGSQPGLNIAFNPVDMEPPSGSAGDRKDDGRENDLSFFFDTDSSPSSHSCCCCCCRSPSSRPSSFSCLNRASFLLTSSGQSMRRICYGSCGASPAAINTTQLIAAAKEHKQDFAHKTLDPQTGQPSSNSVAHSDCVERLQLPLTRNHDHDPHDQQRDTYAASSFAEADFSIEFPPRDRTMGRGLPPPYSPIEPSSSSSPSNSDLPQHLAWLRNTTISLCIDQECFRTVFPTFKLVGYTKPTLPIYSSRAGMQKLLVGGNDNNAGATSIKQLSELMDQTSADPDLSVNLDVGMAEFMPFKRESFVFHHSALDTPPLIRRLSVNGDESRDYLSQHAYLSIKSSGGFQVYAVHGSEVRRGSGGEDTAARSEGGATSSQIKLEWRFEYAVEDKRKADGTKAGGGEKVLTPLRFSCSPGLLHSRQGRKVTVLNVWKKSIQSSLVAGKVELPTTTSPTSPGHRKHNITSPPSSPTSPKSVGIGPLRFPTANKLWGKRAKSSPYRFEKGSDGSEEELIPSEDPGNRRRRPRATSAYVSRVSHEAGRPLQMWGGDRGQSADSFLPASRDAWSTIGSAEKSRGRSKTQAIGRGATSEDENERPASRSHGGHSTSRSTCRRPRTAR